ncbi:MAG: phospholipid carrier-dependent glycosyltransferase [Candidatus Melainabacteria bacterium]|nr:phospholipid carrier-dependent glycosyltransferase [Candidatus Melainabacteria bacterium]
MNYLLIILLFFISLFIRISNISYPESITWDETHFVHFVKNMISGQGYFTDHPPFGRILMYISTQTFGDNALGWRASQALIGALLVPTSFLLAKTIFQTKNAGLITATLITFEPILTLFSRIGVVDIFLIFFMSISLFLFIDSFKNKNLRLFILCSICSGLAIAVKWIGLILIPIYILWHISQQKSFIFKKRFYVLFFAILALSYLSTFAVDTKSFQFLSTKYSIENKNFAYAVINWHSLAFKSHAKQMTHLYSSKWYTWPLLYKPFWLDFKLTSHSLSSAKCFATLGNPTIWWGGLIVLIIQSILFVFKRNKILFFLTGSYLLSLIPFVFISRPMFIYHYIPALFFLILIIEHLILNLPKNIFSRAFISVYIASTIFLYFYFLPFVNGTLVTYEEYHKKLWFENWKYKLIGWEWNLNKLQVESGK